MVLEESDIWLGRGRGEGSGWWRASSPDSCRAHSPGRKSVGVVVGAVVRATAFGGMSNGWWEVWGSIMKSFD